MVSLPEATLPKGKTVFRKHNAERYRFTRGNTGLFMADRKEKEDFGEKNTVLATQRARPGA